MGRRPAECEARRVTEPEVIGPGNRIPTFPPPDPQLIIAAAADVSML